METYLNELKDWLFRDAKELAENEDIYAQNDKLFKKGAAVVTESAMVTHAAAKAEIERRRDNYYKLETEIERIESMLE